MVVSPRFIEISCNGILAGQSLESRPPPVQSPGTVKAAGNQIDGELRHVIDARK
ncbi:MAG: hypothetical protein Q6370_001775 [Candidatus Sigynarchaeota archaeon]